MPLELEFAQMPNKVSSLKSGILRNEASVAYSYDPSYRRNNLCLIVLREWHHSIVAETSWNCRGRKSCTLYLPSCVSLCKFLDFSDPEQNGDHYSLNLFRLSSLFT